ncbi:MAG: aspartate--tRNA ligase [Ignavibacteria bacterium GWF2_33_9]|nr:MAG: aspartate--tRNA ligase [Ignavibacteria bacterium GWF2_33_9]
MSFVKRTIKCGELRRENIGQKVSLNGWVAVRRDLGGLIFIDLRDRWGIAQIVIHPEESPVLAERAKPIRSEFVMWATGTVRERESKNMKIPTGEVEVLLEDFGIINPSELPPFEILNDLDVNEELRLKYRYLDLRRPYLQEKFLIRNKLYQIVHKYFYENDFVEIETPVLMKSTPEGARDFLVPSRIHKGKFYALPQSPQIYKQILMVSGFDRYVQIVKCFRDEDLRSDRQPEFTQIDCEMSFVEQDDILTMFEGFLKLVWKDILNQDVQIPFQRMPYKEAMERYGSDKPDTRFGMEIETLNDLLTNSEFQVFSQTLADGGIIGGLKANGCGAYSRKQLDNLTEFAKKYGAKGLAYIKLNEGQISSPIAKFLSDTEMQSIIDKFDAKDGDLILIISDKWTRAYTILGALRLEIARLQGIFDAVKDKYNFLWVVDFPLFEYDEEDNRYVAMHHPFTSPKLEDLEILDENPGKARAIAHDIVLNGVEIGGGSVRIHDNAVQQKMFSLMSIGPEEAKDKFGHLLDALKYGAPPHGGIALGLDRMVMLLTGIDNIRDVIAFPKTTSGLSLMDNCPSAVDTKQLTELGVGVLQK